MQPIGELTCMGVSINTPTYVRSLYPSTSLMIIDAQNTIHIAYVFFAKYIISNNTITK